MTQAPPLSGIRVLEFAGLAPGPFAGLLCADFGAQVLRLDRAHKHAHSSDPSVQAPPTGDNLTRRKSSIAVNTKTAAGVELVKKLVATVDVVIDPFRPGVLERLGLGPEVLQRVNPRVIVARMTGFRRDGKYKDMAGHDINYIAVSGVLSMLGREKEKPYAPGNILGDFAGGGAVCFLEILLALLQRARTGHGQVVEANMVDGAAYLGTFLRLAQQTPMWDRERGTNQLDGGAPYYDTYETGDGKYMSVGALEPQFYEQLMKGLGMRSEQFGGLMGRLDKKTWPKQKEAFEKKFKEKTRKEWERVFDGTDACVTPVLEHLEMKQAGYEQRPVVTLKSSPGLAIGEGEQSREPASGQGIGVEGSGWTAPQLRPGEDGERTLEAWMGWRRGRHYIVKEGVGVGRHFSAELETLVV